MNVPITYPVILFKLTIIWMRGKSMDIIRNQKRNGKYKITLKS